MAQAVDGSDGKETTVRDGVLATVWCARCGDGAWHASITDDEVWAARHRCGVYGVLGDARDFIESVPPVLRVVAVAWALWSLALVIAYLIWGN